MLEQRQTDEFPTQADGEHVMDVTGAIIVNLCTSITSTYLTLHLPMYIYVGLVQGTQVNTALSIAAPLQD